MKADPGDPRVVSGALWDEMLAALLRMKGLVLADGAPATPRDRAEGLRYLTRFLRAGLAICVEHADPDHPTLCRMMDLDMPWGLDAPDCLYLHAPLRGDATYRLGGRRGTANHLDVQANWGHYAVGDLSGWGTIASCTGDDLGAAPDGTFTLTLSATPQPGPWLRLDARASFLQIRQYFADWERERPAELWIERVDAAWPPPPLRSDDFAARMDRLHAWLEHTAALWDRMSRVMVDGMPQNVVHVVQPQADDAGAGLAGQAYGMGNFRCGPDEAVIVSFTPPRCRQWSVSLADFWWQSIDFAVRQSSLNHVQARPDADGVVRLVVAHDDPGVPNWLDTAGHRRGSLAVRFLLADAAPPIAFEVVPATRLRDALPPDTPVVDAAARAETLRRRRRAAWRRYPR
jgi:hypothetical protein